jgi:hypothetical protein
VFWPWGFIHARIFSRMKMSWTVCTMYHAVLEPLSTPSTESMVRTRNTDPTLSSAFVHNSPTCRHTRHCVPQFSFRIFAFATVLRPSQHLIYD